MRAIKRRSATRVLFPLVGTIAFAAGCELFSSEEEKCFDATFCQDPVIIPGNKDKTPTPPGDVLRGDAEFALTATAQEGDLRAFNQALLRLGQDLLAQDLSHNVNTAVSPLSIGQALGQVGQGAVGQTQTQIVEALDDLQDRGADDALNIARLGAVQHDVLLALRNRDVAESADTDGLKLRLVNQLFAQPGVAVKADFLNALSSTYDTGLSLLDFAGDPEAARASINDYVEAATADKIVDLLPADSITTLTRFVFTNALYLLGAWSVPFEESATSEASFFIENSEVQVPTMHGLIDEAGYVAADNAPDGDDILPTGSFAVELPLVGNQLSVVFISTPDSAALTSIDLSFLTEPGLLPQASVDLSLPKFKLRQSIDLQKGLKALAGPNAVTDLFDEGVCDLTGITEEIPLFATGAFHQTFVAVDEGGIEAAAATAIVVGNDSAPSDQVTAVFDHPFLFVVRDVELGTPLFVGRIGDPSQAP